MTFPGDQGPLPPRPEWRATLAAVSILLFVLCLCVLVVAARGQGDGPTGGLLRRFADVPLFGRLVRPLLGRTPTPVVPSIQFAPQALPPTPTAAAQYLVRPSNWPTQWPWPPRPLNQPAPLPQVQPTAAHFVQPTPAPQILPTPGPTPTLGSLEPLGDPNKGPVG